MFYQNKVVSLQRERKEVKTRFPKRGKHKR